MMTDNFLKIAALAVALVVLAAPGETLAQLKSTEPSEGESAAPLIVRRAQPDALSIGGFTFQVTRLVRNDKKNTLRLIFVVTETVDPGRWVALVQPPAVMIDNMGNEWVAMSSSGIRICGGKANWDEKPGECGASGDMRQLVPNVPQIAVLEFTPPDSGTIDEILELATEATLTARFVVGRGGGVPRTQDITVPGIVLP